MERRGTQRPLEYETPRPRDPPAVDVLDVLTHLVFAASVGCLLIGLGLVIGSVSEGQRSLGAALMGFGGFFIGLVIYARLSSSR